MNIAANGVVSSDARERPSAAEYGFWLFLAIAVGRINQIIPGLSSLPLAKLAVVIAGGAFLAERKKKRTLPALSAGGRRLLRAGIWMVCLAVLLTPASIWPGSSVHFVLFDLPPLIVATAIACSMRKSWTSLRGSMLVLLLCGFVLGALAALSRSHGRADDASTDYDPNDLAYILVTVVPLGLAFISLANSRIPKLLYAFMTVTTVAALLLTESRGGLLGFLTILLLMVFLPLGVASPGKGMRNLRSSVAIALVIACAGAVVWSQLPQSAQERYMTLLHLNHDYNTNLNDTTGREDVWLRGLRALAARPIGYGPNTYPMVDFRFGGKFKTAHNSYLQALVELGPLGLWLFVRMYLLTLRELQRTRSTMLARASPSTDQTERAVIARALQYGVLGNMVSGFFLSDAYSMLPWIIFGLAAAISAAPAVEQRTQPRPPGELRDRDHPTAPGRAPRTGSNVGSPPPFRRHARPR
jgi:O-antigen ligase